MAKEGWVSFEPSVYSYKNTKSFQRCRVFFSHNEEPFIAELYENDALYDAKIITPSHTINTISWEFKKQVRHIKISFKGTHSPDFYGIALDGISGIAVDNVAMRGNSGLAFTKINKSNLKEHFDLLNVKLILYQYGGNVVPYISDNTEYYGRKVYSQLRRLRELIPGVTIIVIGVADMSIKENNTYVSYPNIEKVRDALKEAAFKANAIYWDMYEAMGGKNSMPSWVFADPPLASSDFVHFNYKGAKIIAKMFYNSLMYEYSLYKTSTIPQHDTTHNQ